MLLCALSLLCIVLILVPITFQNDTFYTIRIGEKIANEGLIPIDSFTFLAGIPYTYPHWLYDYCIYMVYQSGGFRAVYISSMLLTIVLGIALLFISYRISNNRFVTYFVVCATLMNLSLNFTARAQLVTYIIFVAEYGLLYAYSQKTINRTSFFIAMMVISTLIVNLHCATWLLFFLIAAPFIAEKIITRWLINKNYPIAARIIPISPDQYSAIFILITLAFAILTGFLTPLGNTPFTYLINTYQGISTSLISEHQPLVPIKNIAFLIFLLQMTYLLLFTRCQFYGSELLLLLGLCLLTLLSVRQSAILFLMNALIAPRLLTQAFVESSPKRLAFYTEKINSIKGLVVTLLIFLPLCYANHLYGLTSKITPFEEEKTHQSLPHYDDHYPVKAMDYFSKHVDPESARIYADYALGSYVLFRGYHPMVDSRADLYTIEFNNKQDYLKEIANLMAFKIHYDDFFEKFSISHILLALNDALNTQIKHDGLYRVMYEDEAFVVYERIQAKTNITE